jgi:aminopeptidase YwaD
LLAALAGLLIAACASPDGDPAPAATSAASPAVAASPTVDPLSAPEAGGDRAYEHVRQLTEVIGPRVAGTSGEIAARDYIKTTLESFGYDVTVQEFPFDGTQYRSARIDVGDEALPAIAFLGSPAGGVRGTLIEAGIGRPEDFPAEGLQGAIALIERGDLTFTRKAENAAAAGAGGVIIYNNEDGALVGDAEGVTLPMVGISRVDGEIARRQLAAGAALAAIEIAEPRGIAYNVVAKPRGVSACRTVSGGHYDSVPVTAGADDNASGAAAVIELARVAAANKLAGSNCFALFGAEEFGLVGSAAFVEGLADADVNGMRAMINLDVVGTDAALTLIGDDGMVELARIEAQGVGVAATAGEVPAGSGSDHFSFQEAGIPVVFLYRHDPLIHTQQDAIGRILPASLEETVRVAYGVLESLNQR